MSANAWKKENNLIYPLLPARLQMKIIHDVTDLEVQMFLHSPACLVKAVVGDLEIAEADLSV